ATCSRPAARLARDAGELFDRGEPLGHLLEPVVPERAHALLLRHALELVAAAAARGDRLERVAHRRELEDADTAAIAGLVAARAAAPAVELAPLGRRGDLRRDARLQELVRRRRVALEAVRA